MPAVCPYGAVQVARFIFRPQLPSIGLDLSRRPLGLCRR